MLARMVLLLTFCLTSLAHADDRRTLTVSSSATSSQPANQAAFAIGVITENKNAHRATEENQSRMSQLSTALKQLGLNESEMQTSQYTLRPKYSQRPQNPPADWKASIVGYEVRNQLRVTTTKMDLLPKIFTSGMESGANTIESLQFSLKDSSSLQQKAIAEAINNAKSFAVTAAEASKVRLEKIHEISINPGSISPYLYRGARMALTATPEVPIEPGEVEASASVTIIYEIDS